VRAARLHEIGGTPRVDEIAPPAGSDLISVSASSLNPVDISIGLGRFYGGTPAVPYVIGSEAVGTRPGGGRVWLRGSGLMAEQVQAASGWTFEVPDGVDDACALACGIAGLTAWLAVSWRSPVERNDTVLVLGASGTVGRTAVQAAKLLGAQKVIGAARRVDRIPAAADETVDLTTDDALPAATLIIDCLWGRPLEHALAAAQNGVRVVQLGQSAAPAATLLSAWIRGKRATVSGHALASVPAEIAERGYRELCEHARDGKIDFEIENYRLDDIAEAWNCQASGSAGKIVIGACEV
jgi:NADPH:quinone reductase